MIVAGSMIGSGIFIVAGEMAREVGSSGWLLLAWVIAGVLHNDEAELQRLGPTSIAVRDAFGRGPLHYAAQTGARDVATTLLQFGADVHAVDVAGTTALMLAASSTCSG